MGHKKLRFKVSTCWRCSWLNSGSAGLGGPALDEGPGRASAPAGWLPPALALPPAAAFSFSAFSCSAASRSYKQQIPHHLMYMLILLISQTSLVSLGQRRSNNCPALCEIKCRKVNDLLSVKNAWWEVDTITLRYETNQKVGKWTPCSVTIVTFMTTSPLMMWHKIASIDSDILPPYTFNGFLFHKCITAWKAAWNKTNSTWHWQTARTNPEKQLVGCE